MRGRSWGRSARREEGIEGGEDDEGADCGGGGEGRHGGGVEDAGAVEEGRVEFGGALDAVNEFCYFMLGGDNSALRDVAGRNIALDIFVEVDVVGGDNGRGSHGGRNGREREG